MLWVLQSFIYFFCTIIWTRFFPINFHFGVAADVIVILYQNYNALKGSFFSTYFLFYVPYWHRSNLCIVSTTRTGSLSLNVQSPKEKFVIQLWRFFVGVVTSITFVSVHYLLYSNMSKRQINILRLQDYQTKIKEEDNKINFVIFPKIFISFYWCNAQQYQNTLIGSVKIRMEMRSWRTKWLIYVTVKSI